MEIRYLVPRSKRWWGGEKSKAKSKAKAWWTSETSGSKAREQSGVQSGVQSARMEMVKTKTVFLAAAVNKAVQDGVSQAAIDRVLGEDPEGKTPEEFRGDMGERRGGGGAPGG